MNITKYISTWGGIAVVTYLVFVASLFYYATHCIETFCGLVALLAGMPWLLFLDILGGDSYNAGYFDWISIFLNIVVLYVAFAALQKFLKKKK